MLEQHLITHCSPTLAGLKTGSLFCFPYPSELQLQAELARCRPDVYKRQHHLCPRNASLWAISLV